MPPMNRFSALFFSALAIFACAEIAHALVTPPNVGPVVTNPMPNYDQYVGTTRAIDLSAHFADPDATAAATLTTPLGAITITLDGSHAPATVANFLNYVNSGRYFITDPTNGARASTFFHRSVPGFIIQGGGFLGTVNSADPNTLQPTSVLTFPAVQNEPFISNIRGTIAMAKLGGDPNSATSQWFISLADNSANLDNQNGGFTAFGHVTGNGMSVADAIAALFIYRGGGVFNDLPVRDYTSPNPARVPNLVSIPELRMASPLAYSASSSDPNVATVSTSDKNLLVTTHQLGSAQITVNGLDLDGAGPVSQSFTVNVIAAPGRLRNISTRASIPASDVLIAGFIMRGGTSKRLVVRAIGPSLPPSQVPNPISDPTLELRDIDQNLIASNDNWTDSPDKLLLTGVGLAPSSDNESALIVNVPSSASNHNYTAIVRNRNGSPGVGLVEVYDLDIAAGSTLLNLSTRGQVGTGDDVLIAGLITGGTEPRRLIVRAVGPSLAQSNVPGSLPDPTLEIRNGQGTLIDSNNDWQMHPDAGEIQSRGFALLDPRESAVIATVPSGGYTAIVAGTGGQPTGVGLVEIYQVD